MAVPSRGGISPGSMFFAQIWCLAVVPTSRGAWSVPRAGKLGYVGGHGKFPGSMESHVNSNIPRALWDADVLGQPRLAVLRGFKPPDTKGQESSFPKFLF